MASISPSKRERVFKAGNGECQYCGVKVSFEKKMEWHVDHVTPKSEGGDNSIENLRLACPSCNTSKGNKNLDQYRDFMAIRQTPYGSIISSRQAKDLIALGLPIEIPEFFFYFEECQQ